MERRLPREGRSNPRCSSAAGRTRTGCSFRGCGTRPAGSDSPRLSRNTPHASGETWAHHDGKTELEQAELTRRTMPGLAACLGARVKAPATRRRPTRHLERSRGCVGHSWRRRGLSERSEFRSLQKECPARPRRITSAQRTRGSAARNRGLSPIPPTRRRPTRHRERSRGCVGHFWRRRGLSERSEFRSLQKECPRASPAD